MFLNWYSKVKDRLSIRTDEGLTVTVLKPLSIIKARSFLSIGSANSKLKVTVSFFLIVLFSLLVHEAQLNVYKLYHTK